MMSFSVTGKGVLKAKFPGHNPLVQNPTVRVVLNQEVMYGGFTSANPEI